MVERLTAASFTASSLYGDLAREERDAVVREFRSGGTRVLVSTDLFAHGLDVQQVSVQGIVVARGASSAITSVE